MKNVATLLILLLALTHNSIQAQIDRSQRPQAAAAPEIDFGDVKEFTLPNGLHVLVIENHKLPRVSVSLKLDNPLSTQGSKVGAKSLLTAMLGKGSISIPKDDFEAQIDQMGAHFHFNEDGAHASSLTRYFSSLLKLLADAALHPNFLAEEFDKEKDKLLEGIKASDKDVKAVAQRVQNLLSYGAQHPYGEFMTKESVGGVQLQDVQRLYEQEFIPNNAYLVIVGDVMLEPIKKEVTQAFKTWKKKKLIANTFPNPTNVEQTQIDFVEMPNAVQSEIAVINTNALKRSDPEYFDGIIANQILGGGAEARLFLNLREDKGFTYGAYSQMNTHHKTQSRFKAGTSVRNAVTDSAVVEILYEINRIREELVDDEALALVKAKYAGNFIRSMEDPETIADFQLDILTENLPHDFYKTFLKKVNAVTKEEVQKAAQKYLLGSQARVVVTGKGSDILSALESINLDGKNLKVNYYDSYGNSIARPDYESQIADITAAQIINYYIKAVGGREKLLSVNAVNEKYEGTVQGMTLEMESVKTTKKQLLLEMKMMGNVIQKQVVNEDTAYMEMQGQRINLEGATLEQSLEEAQIFPELNWDLDALELVGVSDVNGRAAYETKVSEQKSIFYDQETFFKTQIVQTVEMMGNSQTSTILLDNYEIEDGIFFAHKTTVNMGPQNIDFNLKEIQINPEVPDHLFE